MAVKAPDIYVRLDAKYDDDEAMWEVSPYAELLFIRSLAFCKRKRTDGRIPETALRRLAIRISADASGLALELVTAGLWTLDGDGWSVAGWDKWQMTDAEQRSQREAKAQGGYAKAHRNGYHDEQPDERCLVCQGKRADAAQNPARAEQMHAEAEQMHAYEDPDHRPRPQTHTTDHNTAQQPQRTSSQTTTTPTQNSGGWLKQVEAAEAVNTATGARNPKPTLDELASTRDLLADGWTPATLQAKAVELAGKATKNPRRYVWQTLPRAEKPPPPRTRRCPDCRGDIDHTPAGIVHVPCDTCSSTGKVPLYEQADTP